ncbi:MULTISPECIES: (2Fe-2S)-binding protein [unclassified Helicobacter]|uniref:(2Fe-2S)-binding protein n=1 Tax=unclassified Helicobacter TaxID=2593540 RepID=UPI000CF1AC71|nr:MULTISPECIES: (2Fe-2S)-binding protein [unclassified Helicobacter]
MQSLLVDGKSYDVSNVPEDTPILWVLRDYLNLTGAKFGCGVGSCGACSILLDNEVIRGCSTALKEAQGKEIKTIENIQDREINLLRKYWIEEDVAQCGYCQPGQIVNAAGLLKSKKNPTKQEIIEAMTGNLCRCGTYNKILSAIEKTSKELV